MSSDASEQLGAGIRAAKAGQREQAKAILMRVVEQDQGSAQAWLWLSGVVDDLQDRQVCLENVLDLDPANAAARQGLAAVRAQRAKLLFQQGVASAKSGQRAQAREALALAVELDEKNVSAWLWLSGVVNDLQDREVCLQNVLDLDPGHAAARKGLEQIQAQLARLESSSLQEPLPVAATPQAPPRSILTELDDPLLCPYCAMPTEAKDRRCTMCGGNLWIEAGREGKQRSVWLWIVIVFQALGATGVGLNVLMALINAVGAPDDTGAIWLFMTLVYGVMFVVCAGLAVGLYLRWRWVYYVYLVTSILNLGFAVLTFVLGLFAASLLPSLLESLADEQMVDFLVRFYLIVAIVYIFVTLLWFLLILAIKADFEGEKLRLLLDVNPLTKTSSALLLRGRQFIKQKMWALAALHLARAVSMITEQADGRAALAFACVKLRRYDLAEHVLVEAQRISPHDAELKEIQDLLNGLRREASSQDRG
ncbi:MAG: hypothetical protein JW934_16695 [Anaerolineae bacterium]|nr:hypothetical protein [Anaerolineae bacterium]